MSGQIAGRAIVTAWMGMAAALAHAQSPSPVPVTGTVQDQTGAILRDAAVALTAPGSAVDQRTTTDANGMFRLAAVPPGSYDLRVSAEGFEPISVRLRVGGRSPSPQKIVLPLAKLVQEVTVSSTSAELTTAPGDNRDGIVLNPDALANLPVFDQDVVAAASRFLDAGAFGTGGVTLVVDGMEATSVGVSASAIEQIKINADPYTAESARPGRGRIEIITKAGTREYHATTNVTFRDAVLNSRDTFAASKAPEQRRIYEGSASGPILGGKTTSFLVSVDRREEDLQAVVFAIDPSGLVQASVPQPRRGLQLSGTINHQRGDHNTFSLRYTHEEDSSHNQGVGGTTLPQGGSDSSSYEHQVVYGHRTTAGKRLFNELRVTLGVEGASTTSQSRSPRIVVLDAFTGGGAQNDRFQTQHRLGLTDALTIATDRHLMKMGINLPEWNRRRADDLSNVGGTFTFSTLEDYINRRPLSFVEQRGDGHLVFPDKNLGWFIQDQIQARPDLSVAVGLRYDWQNHVSDHNNFAPRASFAYAPGQRRKTVIRGGMGVFYDRVEGGPIADILHSSNGLLIRSVILDPGYPDAFAAAGVNATPPPSVVRFAPDVTIPYTLQYGVSLERQLRKSTSLAVSYVGTHGVDLFRSRDVNAPPPPVYNVRPDPGFGVVRQIESTGRQTTDSLQLTLRGRVTRWFDGSAQYVLARANNDTSGVGALPANNYDLASEWGRADADQCHRFDLIGQIAMGKLANLGVALSLYSGRPYSLRTGRDEFNTGQTNARPVGVSRNTLEGPGYAALDLRWARDFRLGHGRGAKAPTATVGLDAFNVTNRVNYSGYVGNLASPFFGRAVSAQPPRRLQLSCRFKF